MLSNVKLIADALGEVRDIDVMVERLRKSRKGKPWRNGRHWTPSSPIWSLGEQAFENSSKRPWTISNAGIFTPVRSFRGTGDGLVAKGKPVPGIKVKAPSVKTLSDHRLSLTGAFVVATLDTTVRG